MMVRLVTLFNYQVNHASFTSSSEPVFVFKQE